nr:hypothetical protein [Tanacetum cinerariifolium]
MNNTQNQEPAPPNGPRPMVRPNGQAPRTMKELCDEANQHIDKFLEITQHMKQNRVSDDALRLSLFSIFLDVSRYRLLPVCYDDDDDEERSNSLQDNIISGLPPCSAITPNEPVDSLSMGDEHLNTISAMESDEFIKSCVENLVPNPNIRLTKRLLYDNSSPLPPEEFVSKNYNAEIESFSPSLIPVEDSDSHIEEIDLTFTLDNPMLPSIEDDDYDSERDVLILE